ncbi:MAG: helix-turn-helix domain-containing protein [SAR324 cluster bacterium]|uniref:Helix-turn-helix domain-containing protein n=1 Tax=SAR324 cluster bacterium TaxID=2024889 RepID=A0A7X9FS66_9DELT|nr:helix-turn-helix domain-containing protein [SAR324 cluster bacterium]
MSDPDKLLNAQDIARLLQVSKPQVYLMMRRGDFPIVKMGRLVRVRQSIIEAFIDKSTLSMKGGP